jgi:PAN domain
LRCIFSSLLEAELVGERARRDGVERRDKTLQAQIAKEAQAHQDLKREFDKSLDEVATAKANLVELSQRLDEANAQILASARRIEVAKSAARAALFTQNPIMQFASIAAVVATIGFWTYQLIGSAPTVSEPGSVQEAALLPVAVTEEARRKIEEAEQFKKEAERQANLAADADAKRQAAEVQQQRLKDEVQRQTYAAADAEKKRSAAEAEQQRLTGELQRQIKAATDADTKRRDAEADQQRLKVEVQRQTKAAADADTARKAAEAQQERLTEELRKVRADSASFESRPNFVAKDAATVIESTMTVAACQDRCAQRSSCAAFTFGKTKNNCYLYDAVPRFAPEANFDSGVRQSLQASVQSGTPQPPAQQAATLPAANQPASTRAAGLFTIHINTEVGRNVGAEYSADAESMDDCEKMCTARSRCKLFSYNKMAKKCYQYFSAGLTPNTEFDSGVRK